MNTATAQAVLDAVEACKGIESELKAAEQVKEQALRLWRDTLMRGDRVWGPSTGIFVIGDILTDPKLVQHHVGHHFDGQTRLFVVEGKTRAERGGSEWDVYPVTAEREQRQELRERLSRFRDGELRTRLCKADDPTQALAALAAIEQALVQHGIAPLVAQD